jgi:hypothetical protein
MDIGGDRASERPEQLLERLGERLSAGARDGLLQRRAVSPIGPNETYERRVQQSP